MVSLPAHRVEIQGTMLCPTAMRAAEASSVDRAIDNSSHACSSDMEAVAGLASASYPPAASCARTPSLSRSTLPYLDAVAARTPACTKRVRHGPPPRTATASWVSSAAPMSPRKGCILCFHTAAPPSRASSERST
eukprot:scaffold33152_cov143-Isochrysis_galbana.AAC.4